MPQDITWKAHEHSHTDKGTDWFWALGIIAVSVALVSILFQNFLFAILILVGSFTMALLARKEPRELTFGLNQRGIIIDDSLYPYKMLKSFYVQDRYGDEPVLIVDARRFMTPHLVASLHATNPEQIHTYLSEFLPEEELEEPLSQRILEKFGF